MSDEQTPFKAKVHQLTFTHHSSRVTHHSSRVTHHYFLAAGVITSLIR
jgi:hypothetical protein